MASTEACPTASLALQVPVSTEALPTASAAAAANNPGPTEEEEEESDKLDLQEVPTASASRTAPQVFGLSGNPVTGQKDSWLGF